MNMNTNSGSLYGSLHNAAIALPLEYCYCPMHLHAFIVNCLIMNMHFSLIYFIYFFLLASWITLEQGKTTADALGDVWRGLEVVEAATRVGSEMLVRGLLTFYIQYICIASNRLLHSLVTIEINPLMY